MRFSTTTLTLFLTALASLSTTQARIGQTHLADNRMMLEEATAAGNFQCYHAGCPEDGGSLVKNCSKCVDADTCKNFGWGIWLDCDNNRMLEEEDSITLDAQFSGCPGLDTHADDSRDHICAAGHIMCLDVNLWDKKNILLSSC